MEHPLPPFKWPKTPQEIEERVATVLAETRAQWDTVAKSNDLSYEKIIEPLVFAKHYKINPMVCEAKFLQHCHTDPAIREASEKANVAFSKLRVEGRLREDVFKAVQRFNTQKMLLEPHQKHFVERILQDFKRCGLQLEESKRKEYADLLAKDSELCTKYSSNISQNKLKLEFTREELAGLSDKYCEARKSAETGKIVVALTYPDTSPIFSQCTVAETRRKVAEARELLSYGNNLEVFVESINVRQKIASMLGYKHWADYITESRMTGGSKVACDFLKDLQNRMHEPGKKDLEKLLRYKEEHYKETGQEFDGKLNPWDQGFYHEKIALKEFNVDDEQIREYFPLNHVVDTTLKIYQKVLSLTFHEIPRDKFEAWHEKVRLFVVYDGTEPGGKLMGQFYMDMHPREGKYNHAAIFHLLKRVDDQVPVDCMLVNFPEEEADSPALLRHNDVVTFFHEFGHIMHNICAETDGNMTRIAKVPRDFVEAPSQMLENWCWEKETLKKLSRHYKTGEPIGDDLVKNLQDSRYINVAIGTLRQVYLASLDMEVHMNPPPSVEELQALVNRLRKEIALVENPKDWNMLRHFQHLMNQYSAAYHGYLWSEVLSADMFHTRFEQEGLENQKTGMDYRKMILAPGGIGSVYDNVSKFLGRPPNNEAFLRSRLR
eukprot:Sspe_Gene.4189::Locus_1378_Transcript_1_1_Confidence_1.000_Length_2133::g.4189::m.4189/K01392/THOP1; thimet oligopeptidase